MSGIPEKVIPANEMLVMLCADLEAEGMLSPHQRAAFKVALARNLELQELYERFRFTRKPLASSFRAVLSAPVPERLLRTVRENASPGVQPSVARRTRTLSWTRSWASLAWLGDMLRAPVFSPAVAIPALAVSIAAGWLLQTATGGGVSLDARSSTASAQAQHALEVTPSGVKVDVARGIRLEPRFTFATEEKVWCRQFTLTSAEKLEAGGVACRSDDGAWQVLIETGLSAPLPAPPPGTLPAAGPPQSDGDKALDGARSQLKQGEVLGREEEEERIAEHWKRKS